MNKFKVGDLVLSPNQKYGVGFIVDINIATDPLLHDNQFIAYRIKWNGIANGTYWHEIKLCEKSLKKIS